ncbi:hypothetical protein HK100_003075 [Physocladia obscura]|uniref:Zn(2)-C6 fungal-type domain-containing protein n=1 Tax=Physocladia obscura TaxID=109957 RepID=A0AAD5SVE0_9FUNG|nr:hypothetical protein HK100_003075 [Physocladia obscura]
MNKLCSREWPMCRRCAAVGALCVYASQEKRKAPSLSWAKACLVCRSMKKKCGREMPACARCVRVGSACAYPAAGGGGGGGGVGAARGERNWRDARDGRLSVLRAFARGLDGLDGIDGLDGLDASRSLNADALGFAASGADAALLARLHDVDAPHSLAVLNAVELRAAFASEPPALRFAFLAVAALAVPNSSRANNALALAYHAKARRALVLFDAPDLRAVQALYILYSFALGILYSKPPDYFNCREKKKVKGQPAHGFIALTRAVQIALQIGLHVDPDYTPHLATSLTVAQKDERRRVYWILYYTLKMSQLQTGGSSQNHSLFFPSTFRSCAVKPHRATMYISDYHSNKTDNSLNYTALPTPSALMAPLASDILITETSPIYHLCELLDILEAIVKHVTAVPDYNPDNGVASTILSDPISTLLMTRLSAWRNNQLPPHLKININDWIQHQVLQNGDRNGILNLENFYAVSVCILHRPRFYLSGFNSSILFSKNFDALSEIAEAVAVTLDAANGIVDLCVKLLESTVSEYSDPEENTGILTSEFWMQSTGVGLACFEAAIALWYYHCRTLPAFLGGGVRKNNHADHRNRHDDMNILRRALCLLETAAAAGDGMSSWKRATKANKITPLLDCVDGMIDEMKAVDVAVAAAAAASAESQYGCGSGGDSGDMNGFLDSAWIYVQQQNNRLELLELEQEQQQQEQNEKVLLEMQTLALEDDDDDDDDDNSTNENDNLGSSMSSSAGASSTAAAAAAVAAAAGAGLAEPQDPRVFLGLLGMEFRSI